MDAAGDFQYDVFIIDGLQDRNEIDLALLEDISNRNVLVKRRGKMGGTLQKKTAFVITSNLPPNQIFGNQSGIITARSMVINSTGIPLFTLIDDIRDVHNLPAIFNDPIVIPEDYY